MHLPEFRSVPWPALRAAAFVAVLLVVLTACDAVGGLGGSPTPENTPRAVPTPRPTPLPSPPAGAVILDATGRQYSTAVINGVAGVPTIIYFTNNDDVNHNVTIYRNASKDLELFRGDLFVGPDRTVIYEVPALPAGEYYFSDFQFPSMHGTFIVR
jgi:plastocyanin